MMFKLATQPKIIVNVTINDLIYPPFDNNNISNVRNFMASIGKFKLSNVSNRMINE